MAGIVQPSFTSGELAPALHGRVDLARYYTGLKTCRNFVVRQYGGITNRPGTRIVDEAGGGSTNRVRLIPFTFSVEQSYILEFGNGYFRVHKDGAPVAMDIADVPAWVTSTSYGVQAYVKSSNIIYICRTAHTSGTFATDLAAGKWEVYSGVEVPTPYTTADLSYLKFTQSADVMTICHPDYPVAQVCRYDHHIWSFTNLEASNGPFLEQNLDNTFTIFSNAPEGLVTLTASKAMFTADDVGRLYRLEQMPDDATPRWDVAKSVTAGEIRRAGSHYYKALSTGTTGTVRPTVSEPGETESDTGVRWQYLHSGYGIVEIETYTSTTSVKARVVRRLPDNMVLAAASSKTITNVTNNGSGKCRVASTGHGFSSGDLVNITGVVYEQNTMVMGNYVTIGGWTYYDPNKGWHWEMVHYPHEINGWRRITVVDANTFDCEDVAFSHTYHEGGKAEKSGSGMATYKWSKGAWGVVPGYPATTAYYQQRQFFGGTPTMPQSIEASCIGGYSNFLRSPDPLDDEAISYTFNATQVNQIRHFLPLSELIVLTSGGEWVVRGNQDGALTPASISSKIQGYGGASHVPPIVIGSMGLYIQSKGQQVRSIGYSFESDAFTAQDLTVLSSHLFLGHEIQEWAFQQVPFSVAWCVRDDGVLLGLTYMREQEVVGWHRHDTDGYYESVCCIPEGSEDAVYVAVRRTINGQTKRFIERFATREITDIRDAFHMDCGMSYDGRNTTSKTMRLTGGTNWDQTESLTLTASSSTFVSGDVGNAISFIVDNVTYRLRITGYTSGTVVTVQPNRQIPTAYQSTYFTNWIKEVDALSGLSHLEGKTVSILADGNVHPQQVVTSGAITLQYTAGVIHVGLPYISDAETLALTSAGQNLREYTKLISTLNMIVESSRGIWAGPDADHLNELKARSYEGYDQPASSDTGLISVMMQARWDVNGHILVRQSDPLPLSILALIPEVEGGM